MSFTSTPNLIVDPNIVLRDQRHASKLFVDNQFRLAPKQKFLFHVSFGINPTTLLETSLVQRFGQEINMLVKSIDLPSYNIQTEELNQYNRKKVVQYKSKTNEISVKFHDDNMGLINRLWQNYYSYYYADPRSATVNGAFSRTAMQNSDYIPAGYGLDNGSSEPFFKYIKIYQMARHEFVCYHLYNPLIVSWNHNKVDYGATGTMEADMKLQYEAVSYSVGEVEPGSVEGFGDSHYDVTPSPLLGINPDPTVKDPSFVQSLNIENIAPGIINSVINQISQAQNTQSPTVTSGKSGTLTPTSTSTGGLQGVSFGNVTSNSTDVEATQTRV
jgi:hypothetical protein